MKISEVIQKNNKDIDEVWPAIARGVASGVSAAAKFVSKGADKVAKSADKIAKPAPKAKPKPPDLKLDPLPRNRPDNPYWKQE